MKHLFWVIPLTLLMTGFWYLLFRVIHQTFGVLTMWCVAGLILSTSAYMALVFLKELKR